MLCQLAKIAGLVEKGRIVGTCSRKNMNKLSEMGIVPICYEDADFFQQAVAASPGGKGFDAVFDSGHHLPDRGSGQAHRHLHPAGLLPGDVRINDFVLGVHNPVWLACLDWVTPVESPLVCFQEVSQILRRRVLCVH